MHVAIHVQHLLGSGHLVRMQLMASALHEAGHEVLLITGGACSENPGYRIHRLPVLKTNPGDFSTLLDREGRRVDQTWKSERKRQLLDLVAEARPDMLVLETWPFGRRQLEFEILPLLNMVKEWSEPPVVVSSVRDVLQERSPTRRQETLNRIREYVSLVMVHGDQVVLDLNSSFPECDEIPCSLVHTGYFSSRRSFPDTGDGQGEIVVSSGGGAVGESLLQTSVEAALSQNEYRWRILVGPRIPERKFRYWQSRQNDQLVVEANRSDFPRLLSNCRVSVSQLGYNTAVDLLQSGCPAVVVPYESDGETEQITRARKFEKKGLVKVIRESELSRSALLDAVNGTARSASTRTSSGVRLDGTETVVGLLVRHFQAQRAGSNPSIR